MVGRCEMKLQDLKKKTFGTHFFECELELSRVQEQLKQDLGVVFGVSDRLILDLTQSLVVQIIRCKTEEEDYVLYKLLQSLNKQTLLFVNSVRGNEGK